MRNARGHQGENEWQRKKKTVNKNIYNISSTKRVTKKFLEVSRCRRVKQRKRNLQKKCTTRAKVSFLLIRPTDFFVCFCCRRRLTLRDFILCLS